MKGRTKKERRAIGKLVRWIRKKMKRGFDQFRYDKRMNCVLAFKTSEMPKVGQLVQTPIIREHDDAFMAFQTMMYANAFISERDKGLFVMQVINNIDQIYTLDVDNK